MLTYFLSYIYHFLSSHNVVALEAATITDYRTLLNYLVCPKN